MLEFSGQLTTPDRFSYHTGTKSFGPPVGCTYCGLSNHNISQCRNFNPNQSRRGGGRFNFGQQTQSQRNYEAWPSQLVSNSMEQSNLPSVACKLHDNYKPFCSEVGVFSRGGTIRKIKVFRDTSSRQSLVCENMLQWYEFVQAL